MRAYKPLVYASFLLLKELLKKQRKLPEGALMHPIIPDRIRHVKNRQANRLA
jgi:hypothetical protein